MLENGWINFSLRFIFIGILISGCQTNPKQCLPNESISCKKALSNWQMSIDSIIKANFPQDYGMHKAAVWDKEYDSAWVTKGRLVNITKQFLEKLNPTHRTCVAAHELAHLKMGHYYSRIGIIIINSESGLPKNNLFAPTYTNHYSSSSSVDTPEGFGENQEIEADQMAIKLIKKMGLNKYHYLDLLLYLQGDEVDSYSLINHRIFNIIEEVH